MEARSAARPTGAETGRAVAKMEAYLETNRREGRAGRHGYDGRDFGLDAAELDARFAAYRARFGV